MATSGSVGTRAKAWLAAAVVVVAGVAAHGSGALRGIEYEISPTLTKFSLNAFHFGPEVEFGLKGVQSALMSAMQGSASDRIAAAAACGFLNAAVAATPEREQLVNQIAEYAAPQSRDNFLVRAAIGRIATPMTALSGDQPYLFGQLYIRAGCAPFSKVR